MSALLRTQPSLVAPISCDIGMLSLRYAMPRDTCSVNSAAPQKFQNGAIPPPLILTSHRHICAIPHFARYRAIIARYPIFKKRRDTIATSNARYGKYRCWASKQPRGISLKSAQHICYAPNPPTSSEPSEFDGSFP